MCDTLAFHYNSNTFFAKNSDRSPNEPQVLEYIPAMTHSEKELKVTYCTVPQAERTHAVLISRPTWMWGAEIGVNDCGVCIGNEAVFTLGKYGKDGLTGMDMLRLALERCDSAVSAREYLIELLLKYGQGGNCGYDHDFYYDNSFLIADRKNIFVLETAGREWTWKEYDRASISNRLSIENDAEKYSESGVNFKKKHTELFYTTFSGSGSRRKQTQCCVKDAEDVSDCMKALRTHDDNAPNPFAKGTVSSACMHFGGLVGDHTTSSMIVELLEDKIIVWATGSSLPCVSLFKPWIFGTELNAPFFEYKDIKAEKYWRESEKFRRSLIGKAVPAEYYNDRDSIQKMWIEKVNSGNADVFTSCIDDEKAFYEKWEKYDFPSAHTSGGFVSRWNKKTDVFKKECMGDKL